MSAVRQVTRPFALMLVYNMCTRGDLRLREASDLSRGSWLVERREDLKVGLTFKSPDTTSWAETPSRS